MASESSLPRSAPGAHPGRAETSSSLPPGFRMAEFEIERVLGEGGFGIVYLAQDLQLGRPVAIKEYMPSSLAGRQPDLQVTVKTERHRATFELGRRSFINEARLLAQFDHPALVKVLRYWEDRGTAYMAMPFYRARTLKDTLAQLPPQPDVAWLRGLWLPLLEALEHLHAQHCYHRDIAPDNILLPPSGTPILIDFGAARQVIGDATQALTVILKPGFAPIEQYAESGSLRQGPWTDVYALGAVMYHAIAGVAPPPAVARLVADEMTPAATLGAGHYPPDFLQCIDACLAVYPQARPASVREVRLALEGRGGLPPQATHPLEPPPRPDDEDTVILPGLPRSGARPVTRPPGGTLPPPASPAPPLEEDFVADVRPARGPSRSSAGLSIWRAGLAAALVLGVAGGGVWFAGGARTDGGREALAAASTWWDHLAPTAAGRRAAAPSPASAASVSSEAAPAAAASSTVLALTAPREGAPPVSPTAPEGPAVAPPRAPVEASGSGGLIGPAPDGATALLQAHGAADTRWLLQATLERGPVVAGRPLPLRLSTPTDGYVYLLQSQPGSRMVEPLSGARAARPGQSARTATRDAWLVKGRPGPRRLLVIVSVVPRRFESDDGPRNAEPAWDVTRMGDDPLRWPGVPQCPPGGDACDTRFAAALLDYDVTEAAPRVAAERAPAAEGAEATSSRGLSKIVLPRTYGPDEMVPPALSSGHELRRPRPSEPPASRALPAAETARPMEPPPAPAHAEAEASGS